MRFQAHDSRFRGNDVGDPAECVEPVSRGYPRIVSGFGYLALKREASRCLKRVTDAEQGGLIEVLPEELQANG